MVGWLISRAAVGKDGKTPYERVKGRAARIGGVEFGEGVLWKRRRQGGPLGKLSCMWEDGIYLGMKGTTGETIVGNKEGVWRTRTIQRKIEGDRWRKENLDLVGGVPWKIGEEGEDLSTEVTIMDKDYKEKVKEEAREQGVPRRVYIKREDVEKHGYTSRCPGCISILRGTARQEHNEQCRNCLLYTSPSPRDVEESRMPSSA